MLRAGSFESSISGVAALRWQTALMHVRELVKFAGFGYSEPRRSW